MPPLGLDDVVALAKKEVLRVEGPSRFGEAKVEWSYDYCAWLVTLKMLPSRVGGDRSIIISNGKKVLFYMPGM